MAARAIWLMLDGVGLAAPGPHHPLAGSSLLALTRLGVAAPARRREAGFVAHPIDATLGLPGLPQSGTGQTSLLTGLNAAARLGHHHGPWPGPSLRPLLERSLPVRLAAAGLPVRLANAYPPAYLEAIRAGKRRLNAIALAATLAGAPMEQAGLPAPLGDDRIDPETVRGWGRELARRADGLTIIDAWWSDHLGHRGSLAEARAYARRLDALAAGLLEGRPGDALLVVTSDHGNFEAMDRKTHTTNPVPLAALGPGALEFAPALDLTGVAPALARALGLDHPGEGVPQNGRPPGEA